MGNTGNSTGKHLHYEIRNESNKYADNANPAEYMGIPNTVGTYNSEDYQIKEQPKEEPKQGTQTKVFAIYTNIRKEPSLASIPYLYKPNTTVEILQENVKKAHGYIWDKVRAVKTGRIGYVARTSNRYK